MTADRNISILVLGATGYVGGRLVHRLLEDGYRVCATGRSLSKLQSRVWAHHDLVTLKEVDVFDEHSLTAAVQGVDVVYYLVHSMNSQQHDFQNADHEAALTMARVASASSVKRIIYLGGLGTDDEDLSKHLKSRREVEQVLRSGDVPVTVFRAAMIIGSGSASFEILRYLVERLPIMITPRWVKTPNQPIAIRNVIEYLAGCLTVEQTVGETFDIGGKDVVSYLDLMRIYAEEAGLPRRHIIPVPVLTPRLSSLWIHLVTPVPGYIARPLTEGLRNPVVCHDHRIETLIPQPLLDCREAIRKALHRVHENTIPTYWGDAGVFPEVGLPQQGDPEWSGGTTFQDKRSRIVNASSEKVWHVIERIGGDTGWYHGTWLWVMRRFVDRLVGGIAVSRGRRNATRLSVGDVLDFWRVIRVVDQEELVLSAEMKLPGLALLSFRIRVIDRFQCELTQHAQFQTSSLAGIFYWYMIMPLHEYIFGGMINKMVTIAENKNEHS